MTDLVTLTPYKKAESKKDITIRQLKKENAELKDLIKNIIRVTWGEGWNYSLDWKVKAEEFLSCSEKLNNSKVK